MSYLQAWKVRAKNKGKTCEAVRAGLKYNVMDNVLEKQMLEELSKIQSEVVSLDEEYDEPTICAACGNGPTNCQNQW